MQQGVLTYEYHLLSKAGIRQERLNIPSLSGTAIEGKVLEVKKDQVRLYLSIDKAQKKEEATWFSLATPYTAEGHSGFYSPPEEGDSVHLAFPTHREEAAVVRHSVRKGSDSNPRYGHRCFVRAFHCDNLSLNIGDPVKNKTAGATC
ncbi:phage baseplate assembly protein V [Lysinibacillus sp. NPDC093190]|uniref:phage baseplate assembly protein V n=1 Tax=Lysinibacillus sp. NPDC093190 TaxID=3390575 RepID=UPI003D03E18B